MRCSSETRSFLKAGPVAAAPLHWLGGQWLCLPRHDSVFGSDPRGQLAYGPAEGLRPITHHLCVGGLSDTARLRPALPDLTRWLQERHQEPALSASTAWLHPLASDATNLRGSIIHRRPWWNLLHPPISPSTSLSPHLQARPRHLLCRQAHLRARSEAGWGAGPGGLRPRQGPLPQGPPSLQRGGLQKLLELGQPAPAHPSGVRAHPSGVDSPQLQRTPPGLGAPLRRPPPGLILRNFAGAPLRG